MFIRRQASKSCAESLAGVDGGAFATDYPAIWEYLTLDRWEDGKPRQTSTLQVFGDRGTLKAALKDREAGQICFVAGRTVYEALDVLEAALVNDTAEWREDAWKKKK